MCLTGGGRLARDASDLLGRNGASQESFSKKPDFLERHDFRLGFKISLKILLFKADSDWIPLTPVVLFMRPPLATNRARGVPCIADRAGEAARDEESSLKFCSDAHAIARAV